MASIEDNPRPTAAGEPLQTQYPITDITTPDDFIVMEHVADYSNRVLKMGRGRRAMLFYRLIDRRVSLTLTKGDIDQHGELWPSPGLEIVDRASAGFDPVVLDYSVSRRAMYLSSFAVRAAGVISLGASLSSSGSELRKMDQRIVGLGQQLSAQIDEANQEASQPPLAQ